MNHYCCHKRRSPDRSIEHYSYYVKTKNENRIVLCDLNTRMYAKARHMCLLNMDKKQTITAILYDKRGRIVSYGHNSYQKTHPIQQKFGSNDHKVFLHAEIHAIIGALRLQKSDDLSHLSLAISRVCKDGSNGQGFPCDGCIEALRYYGIRNVTYYDEEYGICSIMLED